MAVVEQTSRCGTAIAADGGVGSDRDIDTSGVDVRHPAGEYGGKDHQAAIAAGRNGICRGDAGDICELCVVSGDEYVPDGACVLAAQQFGTCTMLSAAGRRNILQNADTGSGNILS